jgi:protein-arginine kinase activator protein McsA
MLCDNCHNQKRKVAYTAMHCLAKKEINLCSACASKLVNLCSIRDLKLIKE